MFPFIRQHDSMQCGAACIAMIAKYYGVNCSLSEVSDICSPTTEGVSLQGLCNCVKAIGFESVPCKIGIDKLIHTLPCILHWNQNHFVVLHKIKGGNYYIADPGKGLLKCSIDDLIKNWVVDTRDDGGSGVALIMKPTDKMVGFKSKESSLMQLLRFLARFIPNHTKSLIKIFICLLIGSIFQLILPFLTQSVVDSGIRFRDINFIWMILLGELMIVIGKMVADFIRRWLLLKISMRINISLISDLFEKLLKLPMFFFDTKLIGDLLQRIGDHNRVQHFLTGQAIEVVFIMLNIIIFSLVLGFYSVKIFLIFAFGSICYAAWVILFLKQRKMLDYEMFEKQSIIQSRTYQFITSMQEIKLQNCEERRRMEWENAQTESFKVQMKTLKLQQTQEAGAIFINEVKNILITVFAASAVINGLMTFGAMLAVQYIIGQLNSPIDRLMLFIYSFQDVKISLERILEIHDSPNEETKEGLYKSFTSENSIEIENVDFKYDRHALKNTIEGVSFQIPANKVTAIVGASGSGKTTLIKLMLGFYPVLKGAIYVAGLNINEYNLKWWRLQCGVVMQDGVIFSESIARNIAIGDGEIDLTRLEKAARIANIHDYVMGLPLKYDTKIGQDGIGLSQGQKQRILIARIAYKEPAFIFLDEATNALDAQNERAIVENLNEFYKGRTVIVVAHRLSTVKNADQIIVLDGGKVVETGNHESLVKLKGRYYNLVKNQLELGS